MGNTVDLGARYPVRYDRGRLSARGLAEDITERQAAKRTRGAATRILGKPRREHTATASLSVDQGSNSVWLYGREIIGLPSPFCSPRIPEYARLKGQKRESFSI